jgi:hypothetical protein
LFGLVVFLVEIHSAPLPAAGLAQLQPTANFVGRAPIELGIDKGLSQRHRMAPRGLPILGQAREHQLHKPADQVGIVTPCQHQQTRVIDNQGQTLATPLQPPADELIPSFEMQGRGAPADSRLDETASSRSAVKPAWTMGQYLSFTGLSPLVFGKRQIESAWRAGCSSASRSPQRRRICAELKNFIINGQVATQCYCLD